MRLDSGAQVVVADSGPSARPVSVVALPGWKGADVGLRKLVARTVQRGLRVATINLPGMGVSDSAGRLDRGLDELSRLVEEVLGNMGAPAPVVFVGHSFGATIGVAVAGRRLVSLRGLVLVSPVVVRPNGRSGPGARVGNSCASLFAAVLAGAPGVVADAVVRSTVLEDVGNAFLARHGLRGFLRIRAEAAPERHLTADPRAAADQLRVAARHGCLELAGDVQVPTWIVAGDRDQLSPMSDLTRLCDALPRARMRLLPGAGHLAHQEDAEAMSELVADCVSDLASS
ncbi:MAG: alpha/beta hydrolase [Nocardioidaceae bacterium]